FILHAIALGGVPLIFFPFIRLTVMNFDHLIETVDDALVIISEAMVLLQNQDELKQMKMQHVVDRLNFMKNGYLNSMMDS
ncbi:MAG: hypothetical protein ACKVH8_24995, partial [Pirellulales bacterium]